MPRALTHTSARVLEFDSLLDLLRGYASSPLGQAGIAALAPSTDRLWIESQHQLASEIREFRRVGGRFEFSGLLPTAQLVAKSRILGAILETTEIRDVILVVDRAAEWREISLHPPASMKREWRGLRTLSAQIADFNDFLRFFRNKIQPDGTLEDHASPELVRILDEELAEIHRILLEMTRRIGEHSESIHAAEETLCELELQFAKARFAEDYNCVAVALSNAAESSPELKAQQEPDGDSRPRLSASAARLLLHNARHPLLERNLKLKGVPIVPVTIELENQSRQLVITGPNTGGKTVTLKTVALLALMAQSGIPVPADRAELPVFDAVLADIGDYQSIEQ